MRTKRITNKYTVLEMSSKRGIVYEEEVDGQREFKSTWARTTRDQQRDSPEPFLEGPHSCPRIPAVLAAIRHDVSVHWLLPSARFNPTKPRSAEALVSSVHSRSNDNVKRLRDVLVGAVDVHRPGGAVCGAKTTWWYRT